MYLLDSDSTLCGVELRQVQQGRRGRGGHGRAGEHWSDPHGYCASTPGQRDHSKKHEGNKITSLISKLVMYF